MPALDIGGVVLTEGPTIMQYIADRAPEAKLAPRRATLESYQIQSWLKFITSEIHKSFSPLFKPEMPAEAKTLFREQLGKRFDYIDNWLSRQAYLTGSEFSVADAYLFVTSGWSSFVNIDLKKWPAITSFRKRVEERPSVQAAMTTEGLIK